MRSTRSARQPRVGSRRLSPARQFGHACVASQLDELLGERIAIDVGRAEAGLDQTDIRLPRHQRGQEAEGFAQRTRKSADRVRRCRHISPRGGAASSASDRHPPPASLLKEPGPSVDRGPLSEDPDQVELPIVPLELRVSGSTLRLFNTITTFDTPQDVGLQELRIQMSYPMDSKTAVFLATGSQRRRGWREGTPAALRSLQSSG